MDNYLENKSIDVRSDQKSSLSSGSLREYVWQNCKEPHPYLAVIRESSQAHKWNFMTTSVDQAAFLYSIAKALNANKILEIGCYMGHSTLALASALNHSGTLISIEHNPKFVKQASDHMTAAGVSDRVQFLTGEAPLILASLTSDVNTPLFDLIFIDADKRHFSEYWEFALKLTRVGGQIIFDNVLARGDILKTDISETSHIHAVRAFNECVRNDSRAFSYIATIADGMLVATKI